MDRPYTIDHLDHVVLRVRDLPAAVAFYETLGGDVCIRRPDTVSLEMGGGTRVTLKCEPGFAPPGVSSVDHINFAVNAESISAVADYLRAHGVTLFGEEASHTSPTVRMLDPEQNVIEIRLAGPNAAELQEGSLRPARPQ
jgi:catechol 2,3-dioxygenase-like lactoylglutathione lyase family enzyme